MSRELLAAGLSASPTSVDALLRKYYDTPMTDPAFEGSVYCEARAQIRAELPVP
ncbi:MAG: hypothetical protein HC790_10085 [Acaryochloridaceae cyanobacterium CSU_3_4]|nr:hypothetical protein [Acaryochloridaceae cyanobacterium CSU_3_4]